MSDNRFKISNTPEPDVADMDFKQLRNKVQSLIDEMARMKRYYEDAIYNLSSDNFGKSFLVEQNNMKTQIKVTAEAIETMVSDTDLTEALEQYSTITQTATAIELAVVRVNNSTDEKLKDYSTLTQTADAITGTVTKEYVNTLIGDTYVTEAELSTELSISADGIFAEVESIYETKDDAADAYDDLDSYISSVSVRANGISSRVTNLETFKSSVFTQTAYGFTLDGDQTTFTGVIFLTDNAGNKRFDIFHDESQGYEQVFIGSYVSGGLPIHIGSSGDVIHFENCSQIVWGNNAPVAVFG